MPLSPPVIPILPRGRWPIRPGVTAPRLNVGELSRPTPTATGVAFFYLESREEPAAEIIEANRDQIRAQLEAMNQRMIIEAWISDLMDSPGTDLPDGLVNRGS
jgi:hypothetical protein